MDKLFIKKLSQYFVIVGAVTCLYNTIKIIFFHSLSVINFITLGILLFVIGFVYFFGVIKQSKIIPYFQIIVTYVIIYISFFFNPGNVSGLIFSIVNYLLLSEYKIIKKKWKKIIAVFTYVIPILISIFLLGNSINGYLDVYMVVTFFIFFIKMYIEHKKSQEIKQYDKTIELLDEVQASNIESIQIAKKLCCVLEQEKASIDKISACG